ncbi:MAG: HAMP domain-containing protein [Myxococcales bacterium]|nr:HAMP domain-containing protein [Myxococcales bacterium]MCB9642761.1 HAMP domain-containing protein [Myxococcales bacterium]
MRIGLGFRIIFLTSSIVLLTSATLIFLAYNRAYNDLQTSIGRRLEGIANTAAMQIDGDMHEKIAPNKKLNLPANADEKEHLKKLSPKDQEQYKSFLKIRNYLIKVHKINKLNTDIYTLRPEDSTMSFIVMAGGGHYIGHTHQFTPQTRHVIKEGTSTTSKIYFDQHGAWLSAFAPIRNSKNKVVAVLEVDEKLKTFQSELAMQLFWPAIAAALVLLLALFFSIHFAQRLVARLAYLRDVTEKISLGQMDHPIEITTRDEVGELAQALERMRESLKMAMQMLEEDE